MNQIYLFLILCLPVFSLAQQSNDSIVIEKFIGHTSPRGIILDWNTSYEGNVSTFVLERSLDAMNFEAIATIDAKGSPSSKQQYQYEDAHIYREQVYYRLQVKLADSEDCSPTIVVVRSNMQPQPSIMIYPTISSQLVNVVKNSEESLENARIRIFDFSGHLILDQAVANNFLVETIDITAYEAGPYILELYQGQYSSKAKFIKQY